MAFMSSYFKPKKHNATHGFDLSQKHVFHTRVGICKPVMALEYVPGDYHSIDLKSLMRSNAFNTAAFIRASVKVDLFRVNYATLWHPFNQFVTQREDKHSANQKGIRFAPTVSLGKLLKAVWDQSFPASLSSLYTGFDIHGYSLYDGFLELLDMLGYGNYKVSNWSTLSSDERNAFFAKFDTVRVNIFRLAAYQHIWYDIYRDKYRDNNNPTGVAANSYADYVSGFNFDDIPCTDLASSYIENQSSWTAHRIHNLCQLRYHHWKYDLFTSPLPSTQFGSVSTISISGTLSGTASLNGSTGSDFRKYDTASGYQIDFQADLVRDEIDPSYRIAADSNGDSAAYQLVNDGSDNRSFHRVVHTHDVSGTAQITGSVGSLGSFDLLTFRRAEVLQKYREQLMRAGNMVDDTFNAIYGRQPYSEQDNNVQFLGSWQAPFEVNPVEATATTGQTTNGQLGDLAARGYNALGGHKIDVKCDDFGVIMAIMTIVPEAEYNSTGLDKCNRLFENTDFFNPFMQNIGLEAVDRSIFDFSSEPSNRNNIIGYASRDWHLKSALDKVHEGFYQSWLADSGVGVSPAETYETNMDYMHWVAPRKQLFTMERVSDLPAFLVKLSSYYIDPSIYDSVWAVNSDVEDQFVVNAYFDIKSIRPMSVLGLPEF